MGAGSVFLDEVYQCVWTLLALTLLATAVLLLRPFALPYRNVGYLAVCAVSAVCTLSNLLATEHVDHVGAGTALAYLAVVLCCVFVAALAVGFPVACLLQWRYVRNTGTCWMDD